MINGIQKRLDFGFDAGGMRTDLKYFQGTATSPTMETTYGYDTADRLLNIQHLQSATVLENLLYEYDANGNRTKFTRDASQTLTSEATCGTTNYSFDVRNRLVGINGFDALCVPLTASFTYDAMGRRIGKTINGVTTQYIYDGWDIIQEIQGGATTNYIRTFDIDEPLARIKADGTVRHYKTDALGSVIVMTDDTGIVKTTYTYDPFGNTTVTGETSDNPFQYTGRENDGTGLYYYRARYYSAEQRRFISEDPIGLKGGSINLFSYAFNNPFRYIDPLGLIGIDFGIGANIGPIDVTYGFKSGKWNVDLTTPGFGGGGFVCFNRCDGNNKKPDCKSNSKPLSEPPLEPLPLTYTAGPRRLGVSFSDDFCTICINVGPAIGLPINVSAPLTVH